MAKFVKKDKLTMKQGRIVTKKKGKVIADWNNFHFTGFNF